MKLQAPCISFARNLRSLSTKFYISINQSFNKQAFFFFSFRQSFIYLVSFILRAAASSKSFFKRGKKNQFSFARKYFFSFLRVNVSNWKVFICVLIILFFRSNLSRFSWIEVAILEFKRERRQWEKRSSIEIFLIDDLTIYRVKLYCLFVSIVLLLIVICLIRWFYYYLSCIHMICVI